MNMYGIRNNPYGQTPSTRAWEKHMRAQEEKQAQETRQAKLASEADQEAKQALDPNTVPKQRPADRDRYRKNLSEQTGPQSLTNRRGPTKRQSLTNRTNPNSQNNQKKPEKRPNPSAASAIRIK